MIKDSDRDTLISYRLDQARNTITEVNTLIEANLLNIAVNRIYYGMFYCLTALALKYGFSSSKHSQLIGWFNKHFIKTGFIDVKYGRMLRDAFKNRTEGDYVPFVEFDLNDVIDMQNDMKDFIRELELYVQNQYSKSPFI
ncbi:MAG: HEPN domain-containing protein [Mangrovibacterium sp.]|nr:HEPN domain-containing protein [Mangrovibacterium sp.]